MTKQNNNMVALIDESGTDLDRLLSAAETAITVRSMSASLKRTLNTAALIKKFTMILTDDIVSTYIMPLQGSSLGFKTDQVYNIPKIREIAIHAMMLGLPMDSNCINIIGGNLMVVKNGVKFKLEELNRNYVIDFDSSTYEVIREAKQGKFGRAKMKAIMGYDIDGDRGSVEAWIEAPLNSASNEDNTRGKMERRAGVWLYEYLTKVALPGMDEDEMQTKMKTAEVGNFEDVVTKREAIEDMMKKSLEKEEKTRSDFKTVGITNKEDNINCNFIDSFLKDSNYSEDVFIGFAVQKTSVVVSTFNEVMTSPDFKQFRADFAARKLTKEFIEFM